MSDGWRRWLVGARPRTLPAAVVPVIVGTAITWGQGSEVTSIRVAGTDQYETIVGPKDYVPHWGNFLLALVVALALQVGTNFANDYSDGIRGTDDPGDRLGPPRLVGSGLAAPDEVRFAMLVSFGVALLAGLGLVVAVGWELIPVGLACVAAGWFYTGGPRPYGYAGLGEAFVFTFFGVVATVGSTYVQVEQVTLLSFGCGVAIGSLAAAMLVVNNLRDIPSDSRSGKRTLAVRLGDRRTRFLYLGLMVVPYVLLPFIAGLSGRPGAAVALVSVLLAPPSLTAVLGGSEGRALVPALAGTARVELAYGVLMAVGFVISS